MTLAEWFVGEHRAALDGEGRLLLPAPLRSLLNPAREERTFMASLEPEGAIAVRTPEQWDEAVQSLRRGPDPVRRRRASLILAANSARCRLDRQGRLRVADVLLQKAGLDRAVEASREVVIVGNYDDLRLWSPAVWEDYERSARASWSEDLAVLLDAPGSDTLT